MNEENKNQITRRVDPEVVLNKIQQQLTELSRAPFSNKLARLLSFSPSDEALQAYANKSPDRWAEAVAIFGKLSGVTDKDNADLKFDFAREVQGMSLFEKEKLLEKYKAELSEDGDFSNAEQPVTEPLMNEC